MNSFDYTIYILLLPFLAFLINGLGSARLGKWAGWISIAGIGSAAVLSVTAAYQYFFTMEGAQHLLKVYPINFTWLRFTDVLHIDMGIMLDPISVMMLVVITVVSYNPHCR